MTPKLKLAELTSAEAREHLTEDAVILLPMGSLEDQGTHAPMGDHLAAEVVALEVARAATAEGIPTFMAPVIPFGGADYFGSSHGGISLSPRTFAALLDDMFASLARHGLKKLLILNGHGGNVPGITEIALKYRQSHDMFVASMYLWQISFALLPEILGPEAAARVSGHGGDPLTSMGLFHYPHLIREDLMKPPAQGLTAMGVEVGGFNHLRYDGALIQAPIEAAEVAPDGVIGGDPKYASAETGRLLTERLVALATGFIRDHVSKGFAH